MKPVSFPQQNVIYAENQPEYLPLPVFRTPDGQVTSCWQMDWKERLKALLTGKVYVTNLTFNGPLQPQIVKVDAP